MLCSAFSTRLMISRSTVSGDAPGYGKLHHHHRLLDVGNLVDAQVLQRQQPQAHQHDDDRDRRDRLLDAEVREEHGSSSGGRLRPDFAGPAAVATACPSLQRGGRIAQHAVALGEAGLERDTRPLRAVAIAERQRRPSATCRPLTRQANALSPSRTTDAAGSVSAAALRVSTRPSAYRPATSGCCLSLVEARPALRPGASSSWPPGFTRVTLPANSRSSKPWMRKPTCWPVFTSPMLSAETRPSKRRLAGR